MEGEQVTEKAIHFVIDGKGGCWKAAAKYELSIDTVVR